MAVVPCFAAYPHPTHIHFRSSPTSFCSSVLAPRVSFYFDYSTRMKLPGIAGGSARNILTSYIVDTNIIPCAKQVITKRNYTNCKLTGKVETSCNSLKTRIKTTLLQQVTTVKRSTFRSSCIQWNYYFLSYLVSIYSDFCKCIVHEIVLIWLYCTWHWYEARLVLGEVEHKLRI